MNEKGTTDFYLACFIESHWTEISRIEKNNSGNCKFHFPKDIYDEYSKDYYSNKPVNILDFKNKLRDMKSRIINI